MHFINKIFLAMNIYHVVKFCRAVDPTEALCISGVKTYISADDVPGDNLMGFHHDEEVFATEKVHLVCHSQ